MTAQQKFETTSSIIELISSFTDVTWISLFNNIANDTSLIDIWKSSVDNIATNAKLMSLLEHCGPTNKLLDEYPLHEELLDKLTYANSNKIIKLEQNGTKYDYGMVTFAHAIIDNKKYFVQGIILDNIIMFDYDNVIDYEYYLKKIYHFTYDTSQLMDAMIIINDT